MRKTIELILVFAVVIAAFFAGSSYGTDRIKATCDSDDQPTVINGSEYVCLSQRHVEMLRRQQQRSAMRGA